MKIVIKTNDLKKDIKIALPMSIITTIIRFTNVSDKFDNEMTNNMFQNADKKTLIKGLKYLRKKHKGLVLVEVNSSSGEEVKIQI